MSPSRPRPEHLSAADIASLVRTHLPAWMRACEASDTDAIALHATEFGSSTTELLLFACAIKVAAGRGKNVYVTCGQADGQPRVLAKDQFVAVYREAKALQVEPKSKRRSTTPNTRPSLRR